MLADLRRRARVGTWHVRRDALACVLGMQGGRIVEVCTARVEDLDRTGTPPTLLFRTRKGGRDRRIPLAPAEAAAVSVLLETSPAPASEFIIHTRSGGPLDTRNLRRRWRTWVADVVPDRSVRFHDLRHTAAVQAFTASGTVLAAQQVLGHRKSATTEIYLAGPTDDLTLYATGAQQRAEDPQPAPRPGARPAPRRRRRVAPRSRGRSPRDVHPGRTRRP